MDVVIYTTPTCPDCHALKHWLEASGVPYEERDLTDVTIMEEVRARTGVRVAPITFAGSGEFFYGTFASQRPKIAAALGLTAENQEGNGS
ncbi:glutaredoxin family protein [Manganibacter manganicus]|nr:glutaredoxin [Pseudaminobacter manganicus]